MRKYLLIALSLVMVVGFAVGLVSQPASATGGASCQNVTIPVTLVPLLPAHTVSGELCMPIAGTSEVDVLVPGATYNRTYWDWPQNPALYSYKQKTLDAGRATFLYDRLGTGASSRPLSASLTLDSDAYVLHRVVGWLRDPARGFGTVTTIGHSLGSGIAIAEAATYHDVDRVVVTGFLHAAGSGLAQAPTMFQPAALDPQFGGQVLDPGYLTTLPGTRSIFYNTAFADPVVIAYDEAHKDVVSATESSTFLTMLLPPQLNVARHVTADVFVISGQQDALSCGLVLDCTDQQSVFVNEQQYFTAAASLATETVPNTGHDLTLHLNAGQSFASINQWITTH